jgi:uncharacterized protein YjbJ (UPF0337 family)
MPQTPEQIAGKLKQVKGEVNKQWGSLSERELLKVKQMRASLVEKMRKKSGHDPEDTPPTE